MPWNLSKIGAFWLAVTYMSLIVGIRVSTRAELKAEAG